MPRRHLVARARDRHGRGRPRDPGRVPEVGRARAAADRPRRARARRRLEGPHLPEVPRRPARVRRRRAGDARGRDRGDARSRATRSTCSRSRSSRSAPTRRSRSTSCTRSSAARYPFADLSRVQLENVLDMLAGRYPSDEFAELRPRIVWDRTAGVIRGREGARRLAVTNAGTIPDRGLFGVFQVGGGGRVGELDEEMVYEARAGQTFMLGASTWRIEEITRDRVLVSPAPGVPGAVPFWKGEGVGRPYELGEKIGAASRELAALSDERAHEHGCATSTTSTSARRGTCSRSCASRQRHGRAAVRTGPSSSSASATRSATGASASSRRSAAACTRRGRWRSRRGSATRSASRCSRSGRTTGSRCTSPTPTRRPRSPTCSSSPEELEDLVVPELGRTALFGARFRENAARALLIPRRRPGQRTPLWQQRLKAQSLLQVARRYGSFPIVLETYRECLQDVFDLPALRGSCTGSAHAQLDLVEVETASASPFAASLLFDYVATYMYEDDTPPAERRAQALSLDRELLRELLGQEELRDLLDPDALAEVEASLRPASRATPTSCTTCCGARATCARRSSTRRTPRRSWRAARAPRPDRRRRGLDRRRGRGPLPRRARRDAARRAARRVPRAGGRRARAARAALRPRARAVHDRRAARRTRSSPTRRRRARRARGARPARPRRAAARAAASASGATPTCCGACAAPRSRRCGARSSRPSRRRSAASSRAGTGSTAAPRCARRSCRCRALALPVALWESEVLPRRVPGYRPARSTSSAPPASSSGSARGSTASPSTSARTRRCSARPAVLRAVSPGEAHDAVRAGAGARAPSSGPTCSPQPGSTTRRRCPRSGISSGRAR